MRGTVSAVASWTTTTIAMPTELVAAVEEAANAEGKTMSDWIVETAAHRLRTEAGRRGIEEWEAENGPFTPEERAAAKARVDALLSQHMEIIEPQHHTAP